GASSPVFGSRRRAARLALGAAGLAVALDDLHRDGRRHLAAVAAVLDEDDDRDLRPLGGEETGEPGVVAVGIPSLPPVVADEPVDLRGARLPGHPPPGPPHRSP